MEFRNILNMVFICIAMFFGGLSLSLLSPFYPHEALKKGVSVTKSGVVVGAVFITTVICTPLCGKFINKIGAKNLMMIGSTVCALGNILFGFLTYVEEKHTFFALSVTTRILTAVGEAAISATCYPLAVYQFDKENEGKALSIAEAFFGVGTMLGASVGGLLYDFAGFSIPFYVCGGILLVSTTFALLCFDDKTANFASTLNYREVTWMEVLRAPGCIVGITGLIIGGSARSWYAASLEPFLNQKFGLTSAHCGLVFMAPGLTYTITTPIFGTLIDRGLNSMKVMIFGIAVTLVAFIFMGPIPQFQSVLGTNMWMTIVSIGIQGIGTAATFLGCLMLMMKGASNAGLPDSEQLKGMVSSLWLLGVCLGSYLGTTLGSSLFDSMDFESSTFVESMVMATTVGCLIAFYLSQRLSISWVEPDQSVYTIMTEPLFTDEERPHSGVSLSSD